MEQHPLELLNNWKVVAGIGGIIVVILLLSFLLSLFQSNPKINKQKTASTINQKSPVAIPTSSSQKSIDMQVTKAYQGSNFTLKYPASWHVANTEFYGSNVSAFSKDEGSDPVPQFMIETLNSSTATYSLLSVEKDMQDKGDTKSTVFIDGIKADKFVGIYPPSVDQSLLSNIPLQWETNIFFTKGNIEYAIRYKYLGDHRDQSYEEVFSTILANMKLP